LALSWPAAGIGFKEGSGKGCFIEGSCIEIARAPKLLAVGLGWGLGLGRFRLAKQTPLQGQLRLLLGWRGHGWGASRG
jgi:hypothetical protein